MIKVGIMLSRVVDTRLPVDRTVLGVVHGWSCTTVEWSGVVKVRYESMVMVRRALVGDLNMLCKHAFLAGPCAGIRGIRGTLHKQVKSKERQRWERFRVNTSSVGNSMLQVLIGRDVVFSHASDATVKRSRSHPATATNHT